MDTAARDRRVLSVLSVLLALGSVAAIIVMRFIGPDPYGPDPSTSRGGDFTAFGAAARALHEGLAAKLYDPETYGAQLRALFPPHTLGYEASYPPPVYQLLAPFMGLPWGLVTRVHGVLQGLLFVLAALALVRAGRTLERSRWIAAGFLGAGPVFIVLQDAGQISGLWYALLAAGILAWSNGRAFTGGLVLGLLWGKPLVALIPAIALLLLGQWRVLGGTACGGALLGAVSFVASPAAWGSYLESLTRASASLERFFTRWPRHANFRSILSWSGVPSTFAIAIGAALGLVVAIAVARRARGSEPFLAFAAMLSAVSVATPHLFDYDQWIHAPSFAAGAALVVSGRARRPRLGIVLGSLAWWVPMMYHRLGVKVPISAFLILAWVAWLASECVPERAAPSPNPQAGA